MSEDENMPKPESLSEMRMADLAVAANEYEPFIYQAFDKHGPQFVPMLIMTVGNALTMVRSANGAKLADPESIADERVTELFTLARAIARFDAAELTAFFYALGSEISEQVRAARLAKQIDEIGGA